MTTPATKQVRAIDVRPYQWAIWCTVGRDTRPFANAIESRRWSEDGQTIWFLLGTPYLVPVASLISKGDTMPAAQPLTTADALKRILSLLNRIPEDVDRKRVLAALAALSG